MDISCLPINAGNGEKLGDNDKFCFKCGANVAEDVSPVNLKKEPPKMESQTPTTPANNANAENKFDAKNIYGNTENLPKNSSITEYKMPIIMALVIGAIFGFVTYNIKHGNTDFLEPLKLVFAKKDYDYYINLGNKYRNEKKYTDTIDAYKKVLEINPKNSEATLKMSKAYYYLGDSNIANDNSNVDTKKNSKNVHELSLEGVNIGNTLNDVYSQIGKESSITDPERSGELRYQYPNMEVMIAKGEINALVSKTSYAATPKNIHQKRAAFLSLNIF